MVPEMKHKGWKRDSWTGCSLCLGLGRGGVNELRFDGASTSCVATQYCAPGEKSQSEKTFKKVRGG